jgi:DNA-binding transcriptional LysR family regulator
MDEREEKRVRLSGIDLNLLVAFDALMAERSVTRAAERLSVGQPAMSSTLARLRRLFDDPLLVREGRTLQPTPFAESLIEPVARALTILENAVQLGSSFDPSVDERTFSIAASDYVTLVFLRPLLTHLAAEAPKVRIHIRPIEGDDVERLRRGDFDLLILPREAAGEIGHLSVSPLFTDRFVCAVGADNPQVGDTITVEELARQPYLSSTTGSLRSLAEEQLEAMGIGHHPEVTTRTFLLAPFLLPGAHLLTLIHERLGRLMRDELGLPLRLLEPPVPLRPITEVMLWTSRHHNDAGLAWLRHRMHTLASEL